MISTRNPSSCLMQACALAVMTCSTTAFAAAPDAKPPPGRPEARDTYTITATLELAKPFNL